MPAPKPPATPEAKRAHAGDDEPFDPRPTAFAGLPVIEATTLFGTCREILIRHAGAHYRLRITQHNKLILTK